MTRKIRIGIIWANPYSENLGVSALAYSALAILNDVCNEHEVKAEFTFIGSNGIYSDNIYLNNEEIAFHNVPGFDFLELKSLAKLLLLASKYKTRRLLGFDLIFDIAEGDSFTDIYGDKRFHKILNSKRFFKLLGTKQVLLPQTIGPFISKTNEHKAFEVMGKLEKIISRDKKSFEYTAKFLPAEKITEAIDVAFYLPFKKLEFDSNKVHIGINISGLLWNGGYTKNNQFRLKSDYRKLIENIIGYFLKQEGVVIHLVSHVISEALPIEDDYTVAAHFHQLHPETVLAPKFKTPIEAKSYIGGLHFFTGARMHACIAAFSTGVPVIPMAYSRKFNGLFCETLNYKWMADCVNEAEEANMDFIKSAYEQRHTLENEIREAHSKIITPRLTALKTTLYSKLKAGTH